MTHELRDDTLQAVPGGIAAICTCGWTSGPRFSGLVASALFRDHQRAEDPPMEEILASIRRILADETEAVPLCRGGRTVADCRAQTDRPGDPFLGEKQPGWHCAECSIPPGTRGPVAREP